MVGFARRIGKLAGLFGSLARDYRIAARLQEKDPSDADGAVRSVTLGWIQRAFDILGLECEVHGTPLRSQCVMVGNHMSYLDILVLQAHTDGSFLSKSEIARWPLIGRCSRIINTIFVDRASKEDRKQAVEKTSDAIAREGRSVIIFPEGTTSVEGKDWKPGAFRVAARTGVPIQPFRLDYAPKRVCAYVDDDTFVFHLWRLVACDKIKVRLAFDEPIAVTPETIDEALARAHQCVRHGFQSFH